MIFTRLKTSNEMLDGNAVYFPEGPGYLFVKKLGGGLQADVSIVRALNDDSLYVRKRYNPKSTQEKIAYIDSMPLEVRISTLTGALPQDSPHFNHLVAWADHSTVPQQGQCVLIHRFINGGRLDHLMANTLKLPEAFIWHCILHIGTAIALLHERNIVHRDLDTCNLLLQYSNDPKEYPMPVVCEFGYAGYTTDTTGWSFLTGKHAHPQPWEDIYQFGRMIYALCCTLARISKKPKSTADCVEKMQRAGLSAELCHWVGLLQSGAKAQKLMSVADGKTLPTTAQVVEVLLPLAKRRLHEFEAKGELYPERLGRPKEVDPIPAFVSAKSKEASEQLDEIESLKPWSVERIKAMVVYRIDPEGNVVNPNK